MADTGKSKGRVSVRAGMAALCWSFAATCACETLHIGRSQAESELTDRAETVLRQAYGALGDKVVFVKYPLRRSLVMTDAGMIDGDAMRIEDIEPEFKNLIRLKTPIVYFNMALYARAPCPAAFERKDLQGKHLAYERGVLAFERWAANTPAAEAADTEDVMKMLERDVVDFGLLVDVEGDANLRTGNHPALCRVQAFAVRVNLYHYLHRSHRELAARLEKVLQAMARSGDIRRINDPPGAALR